MKLERSITAFARARKTIAGGVNSPVRALGAVGLSPVFMKSGAGAMLYDLDGHEYIDYLMSWGALLLGHAHPAVSRAITNAVTRGTSFGTPTEQESEMAEMIASMMPSMIACGSSRPAPKRRAPRFGWRAALRDGRKSSSLPVVIMAPPIHS